MHKPGHYEMMCLTCHTLSLPVITLGVHIRGSAFVLREKDVWLEHSEQELILGLFGENLPQQVDEELLLGGWTHPLKAHREIHVTYLWNTPHWEMWLTDRCWWNKTADEGEEEGDRADVF